MQWVGFQCEYLSDHAPQKCVTKSRRCGFSEVISFERACRAAGIEPDPDFSKIRFIKPVHQNFVSAGLEQSKRLLAMSLNHLRALEIIYKRKLIAKAGKTLIELVDGTELRAFSSNPNTLRGVAGDVVLDEFAFLKGQDKVWAAVVAIAKATLGNAEGYRIVVLSTPFGDDNLFHEIARGRMHKSFSQHTVDVHRAKRDGFPIRKYDPETGEYVPGTLDDLRLEVGDPDTFAQEFECSFLSASTRYISAETYDAQCYDYPKAFPPGPAQLFGGMDVARERDNSAIVDVEKKGDTLWHTKTETMRKASWDTQEAWVDQGMGRRVRFAVDSTGIGSQFAERMEKRWPGQVEGIDFTGTNKEVLATGLKLALERGRLRPRKYNPESGDMEDFELRKDVLNLRREFTQMGNVRYLAPRTKSGHADRAWALALAVYAAGGVAIDQGTGRVHTPRSAAAERGKVLPDWGRPKRGGPFR